MAMIITMALPTLGLIFFFLPFWTALLSYLCCLILSGLMYYGMFSVIGGRRKVQSGFKKMTGEETWVIADIDPEGKVEIEDEIWKATTRGRPFKKGEKVRITGHEGITLIVEESQERISTMRKEGLG